MSILRLRKVNQDSNKNGEAKFERLGSLFCAKQPLKCLQQLDACMLFIFELFGKCRSVQWMLIKDGAYYCSCAYVLRISRYSDFLSPMLTNTGIFLRGLKLSGESRS